MARAAPQIHAVLRILPVAQQLAQMALRRAASLHQTQVVISQILLQCQKQALAGSESLIVQIHLLAPALQVASLEAAFQPWLLYKRHMEPEQWRLSVWVIRWA